MTGLSKNHTLKGGTSPYSKCMGVPPPPPRDAVVVTRHNYLKFMKSVDSGKTY